MSGNSVLRKCGLGEGSHTTRAGALVFRAYYEEGALVCRVLLEQSDRSPIPNRPKVEGTCPRCVLSAPKFPDGLDSKSSPVVPEDHHFAIDSLLARDCREAVAVTQTMPAPRLLPNIARAGYARRGTLRESRLDVSQHRFANRKSARRQLTLSDRRKSVVYGHARLDDPPASAGAGRTARWNGHA